MRNAMFLKVLILGLAMALALPARAQESPMATLQNMGLPEQLILDLKELVDDRTTPVVRDVVVTPETPGPGEPVRVTANIYASGRLSNTPVFEAYILYTTNGGVTWSRADMQNTTADNRLWAGEIPGQPQGAEVQFGLQAFSVNGEMYSEVVCDATEAGLGAADEAPAACEDSDDPAACALSLPRGCLFPISFAGDDLVTYEDVRTTVAPALDFRNGYVAHVNGSVLFRMQFKGDVSHGSLSPPNLQFYTVGWLNPDKAGSETGLNAILKQGGVVIYALPTLFRECTIYQMEVGLALDVDATSGTCSALGRVFEVRLPDAVMAPNPSREIELVVMSIAQAGPNMVDLKLRDASLFTRLKYVKRGYAVQ